MTLMAMLDQGGEHETTPGMIAVEGGAESEEMRGKDREEKEL